MRAILQKGWRIAVRWLKSSKPAFFTGATIDTPTSSWTSPLRHTACQFDQEIYNGPKEHQCVNS